MINVLKWLIEFLINPLNILIICLGIVCFFSWKQNMKWLKRILTITVIVYLATATPILPNWMMHQLEKQYSPLQNPDSTLAMADILVLGSGHTYDTDYPAVDQLSPTALQRLIEGIRLYRLLPESRMVFVGSNLHSSRSHARVMAAAAESLGVVKDRILVLNQSESTEEEAKSYLSANAQQKLVLVTSASHMPRAMRIFQNVNMHPIAAPTAHFIKNDPGNHGFHLFATNNFDKFRYVMHEWLGMVWLALSSEQPQ